MKDTKTEKMSKGKKKLSLELVPTPDILSTIGNRRTKRPKLVIGFAAQTIGKGGIKKLIEQAREKRKTKNADWILANDVSIGTDTFGGDHTNIHFITSKDTESWPRQTKDAVAKRLVTKISEFF